MSADDVTQVTQRLLQAAKAGEPWAVRELLDRLMGKPHVQVELQADTTEIREYDERLAVEAGLSRWRLWPARRASGSADRSAEPARPDKQRSPYFLPLFFLGFLTSLRRALLSFPI